MHSNTPLHSVEEELDAVICSTTCSKMEDARLSSSEDFATGKCRSIDRLAEKGFCNKSSNKPSLLNRKQFPRASSYIPDTNWPFK